MPVCRCERLQLKIPIAIPQVQCLSSHQHCGIAAPPSVISTSTSFPNVTTTRADMLQIVWKCADSTGVRQLANRTTCTYPQPFCQTCVMMYMTTRKTAQLLPKTKRMQANGTFTHVQLLKDSLCAILTRYAVKPVLWQACMSTTSVAPYAPHLLSAHGCCGFVRHLPFQQPISNTE